MKMPKAKKKKAEKLCERCGENPATDKLCEACFDDFLDWEAAVDDSKLIDIWLKS